jgi:MFS family permease
MGGNLGNAIGPFGLGVIIGATTWLTWERVSVIMGIPLLFLAVVLWLVLRRVPGREGKPVQVGQYFSSLAGLLKNKVMLGLVISGGIRAMGTGSIFAFFSLYCKEELGFSIFKTGVYYTMMMASGIASQPVLGWLSDKLGRKAVMVPSLFIMGVLVIILVWSGSGVGLAIVALGIGLFIYSVGAIIQAAAMDATPEQTGAMTIALLFGSSALFTIPSPTIAGWLSETYGTASVFLYSGALVLLSVLILVFIPIPRPRKGAKVSGG